MQTPPGILFHGSRTRPAIAITFDDGPHAQDTARVLNVLAKHGVRATFFLLGHNAEQCPQLVQQICADGHLLALHGYRHIPFPLINASTLKSHLTQSRNVISRACNIAPETIRYVRPPYGLFTATTLSRLNEWGYRLVLWDNMPLHFIQPVRRTVRQILENTAPGSIIVLHDGQGHGSKVADMLEIVLPQLKAKGFAFVTIDQLQV